MSSSCLRHNRVAQRLADFRDQGVMHTRGTVSMMASYWRGLAGYSVCVWGMLINVGLMEVVVAEGTSPSTSHLNRLVRTSDVEDNSRHINVNRRDPFKRVPQKHLPIPKVGTPSQLEFKNVPLLNTPDWRLLGVMHGQDGHQAVIQVSPTKRILVQPGAELARSGWKVKTISEKGVLLEHLSSVSPVRGPSKPRTFILSFPAIQ